MEYDEQILRIKTKLAAVKKVDRKLEVFGADSHKYFMHPPLSMQELRAFEETYEVQLPECYKAFLLQVGNGGTGYLGSGAGPFYGLYSFGENVDELICEETQKHLGNACILYPGMTDEEWNVLTATIDADDCSDEVYEKEMGKLFGGILPIGSQGCTYLHGIVLNGPHTGRVINLDTERQIPKFTYEDHFLDWYERWLDEIISGELLDVEGPSWFGYSPKK